jgi:hypothetical protein
MRWRPARYAGGDVDEAWTAAWLRERVRFVDPAEP